jgi:hypothetical protein
MNAKRMVPGALFAVALGAIFLIACGDDDSSNPDPNAGRLCGATQSLCDDVCVDTAVDQNNCGECGNVCGEGEVCSNGECGSSCGGAYAECGGKCANVQYDINNCGACGKKCGTGQVCSQGACSAGCGTGAALCGDSSTFCADTMNDRANCGGCGIKCAKDDVCNQGHCATSCVSPLSACGGACLDTRNDPAHCGGCDKPACAGGANATAVCAAGECGIVCQAGFANCDAKADTGCETAVDTALNCGACGNACTAPANATPECTSGACAWTCNPGFVKNATEDGCEAQFTFPSETSYEECAGHTGPLGAGGGPNCGTAGEFLEETFAYGSTTPITSVSLDFEIADYTVGCAVGEAIQWDVFLNGTQAGSVGIVGGSGVERRAILATYASFPPVAPDPSGNVTLRLELKTSVCPSGGSLDWYPGGTVTFH